MIETVAENILRRISTKRNGRRIRHEFSVNNLVEHARIEEKYFATKK